MILDSYKQLFAKCVKEVEDDGAGGTTTTNVEAEEFYGYKGINADNTGVENDRYNSYPTFTLLIDKSFELATGDLIMDEDRRFYTVVSDSKDHFTPKHSPLNMRAVTIKECDTEDPI